MTQTVTNQEPVNMMDRAPFLTGTLVGNRPFIFYSFDKRFYVSIFNKPKEKVIH